MIRKRWRVVLFCAALVAMAAGAAVAFVKKAGNDRPRFDRIRAGMTKADVIAIMARPPRSWSGPALRGDTKDWPPPDGYQVATFGWPEDDYCIVVYFGTPGYARVTEKEWFDRMPTAPFWDRLREWLQHL